MQLQKVLTMYLSIVLKVATPRELQCIKMIFHIAYSCMTLFIPILLVFFLNFYIQWVIFATSYVALICFVFFCTCKFNVNVVVQFYPWFKFYFSLFLTHYHTLPYPKRKGNKI